MLTVGLLSIARYHTDSDKNTLYHTIQALHIKSCADANNHTLTCILYSRLSLSSSSPYHLPSFPFSRPIISPSHAQTSLFLFSPSLIPTQSFMLRLLSLPTTYILMLKNVHKLMQSRTNNNMYLLLWSQIDKQSFHGCFLGIVPQTSNTAIFWGQ